MSSLVSIQRIEEEDSGYHDVHHIFWRCCSRNICLWLERAKQVRRKLKKTQRGKAVRNHNSSSGAASPSLYAGRSFTILIYHRQIVNQSHVDR